MTLPTDSRGLLDEAAERLVEEWQDFGADAISQAEVAATVADLTSRVARAVEGRDEAADPGSPLERQLLAGLRRILLRSSTTANANQLVPLLQAIESVVTSLDAGWSERFQDRLSGPSGLDLVVEVAHDLRSPLTSILFLAETMLRGRSGPLTPLQERQLGLVYSAAFGLNAVASDVIELVRGGDRLVGRETQPFSVAEVLESVGDIVLPIAEEKGLTLNFTGPEHDRRSGHPGALNRVLLNLTTNALKFTAEGGVTVTVSEQPGNPLAISCTVRDSGRGIPEAAMPMLFEPFRRRHKAGDYAFSGSGLGLSICRKLVEAMGSELTVETVQGQGTSFSFELIIPLADPGEYMG